MNILNINEKRFINCKSIIDYKDKITSIYKDKCFLLLKQIELNEFSYNVKCYESVKDFALVKIKNVKYRNFYYYYPEFLFYASNPKIKLNNIFITISQINSLTSNFEASCYLELTKELVYELE